LIAGIGKAVSMRRCSLHGYKPERLDQNEFGFQISAMSAITAFPAIQMIPAIAR